MDCNEFVTQRFTAFGPSGLKLLKAYANDASDEIHRLRAALDEATTHISWLERQLDNASAVTGIGIQQVVAPELEDVMATSTAEVEAEGMRAVAEAQAESVRAAALVQAECAEASALVEGADNGIFKKTSCPTVGFSPRSQYWHLSFNYYQSKTGSNLKRVFFSGFDSKEAAVSSIKTVRYAYEVGRTDELSTPSKVKSEGICPSTSNLQQKAELHTSQDSSPTKRRRPSLNIADAKRLKKLRKESFAQDATAPFITREIYFEKFRDVYTDKEANAFLGGLSKCSRKLPTDKKAMQNFVTALNTRLVVLDGKSGAMVSAHRSVVLALQKAKTTEYIISHIDNDDLANGCTSKDVEYSDKQATRVTLQCPFFFELKCDRY